VPNAVEGRDTFILNEHRIREDAMSTPADQTIDVLRSEHDTLATIVADLTLDDLNRPSGASDWTVAQVLSHLGSGAEITRAGLEAALTGIDERTPEFNPSVWDRWNAKSPAEQAADFIPVNEALVARYESIDAADRESLRIDLGFLPRPVDLATAVGLRLNEYALHSWDVRVSFDPDASVPSNAAAVLLDGITLLFGWLAHADAVPGVRGTLAVQTIDPQRSFGVDFGESITLAPVTDAPDAVLSGPAEAWLRLITGRLAATYTPATLALTGDLVSLDDLRRVFPGF